MLYTALVIPRERHRGRTLQTSVCLAWGFRTLWNGIAKKDFDACRWTTVGQTIAMSPPCRSRHPPSQRHSRHLSRPRSLRAAAAREGEAPSHSTSHWTLPGRWPAATHAAHMICAPP
eukprot:2957022-Prymnesium_polylepis.1